MSKETELWLRKPERGMIEDDSLWMAPDFGPEQGMRGPEIGIERQGCIP